MPARDNEGDELTFTIVSTTTGASHFGINTTSAGVGVIFLTRAIDREVGTLVTACALKPG